MLDQRLSGRSILVLEDNVIIALDLQSAFESAGASVSVAHNVRDGMRVALRDKISAAVVDFGLGSDTADIIVNHLRTRNIPYVLHSGYENRALQPNGGIVIRKPADPSLLIDAIASALSLRRMIQ